MHSHPTNDRNSAPPHLQDRRRKAVAAGQRRDVARRGCVIARRQRQLVAHEHGGHLRVRRGGGRSSGCGCVGVKGVELWCGGVTPVCLALPLTAARLGEQGTRGLHAARVEQDGGSAGLPLPPLPRNDTLPHPQAHAPGGARTGLRAPPSHPRAACRLRPCGTARGSGRAAPYRRRPGGKGERQGGRGSGAAAHGHWPVNAGAPVLTWLHAQKWLDSRRRVPHAAQAHASVACTGRRMCAVASMHPVALTAFAPLPAPLQRVAPRHRTAPPSRSAELGRAPLRGPTQRPSRRHGRQRRRRRRRRLPGWLPHARRPAHRLRRPRQLRHRSPGQGGARAARAAAPRAPSAPPPQPRHQQQHSNLRHRLVRAFLQPHCCCPAGSRRTQAGHQKAQRRRPCHAGAQAAPRQQRPVTRRQRGSAQAAGRALHCGGGTGCGEERQAQTVIIGAHQTSKQARRGCMPLHSSALFPRQPTIPKQPGRPPTWLQRAWWHAMLLRCELKCRAKARATVGGVRRRNCGPLGARSRRITGGKVC